VPEPRVLRAATRSSPLARWQAEHVAALVTAAHPGVTVELVPVDTEGDRRLDVPISTFGGKGVFAKEVQAAVLDGRADLAVHSAKDLPAVTVEGLVLASVPERGEVRDALVGSTLAGLLPGATVATGSQRRRAQLSILRPDLAFAELRGNMATRLGKVPEGGAIVVAAVALHRLGLADRLTEVLDESQLVPQVGQGALAIECRADDDATRALLAGIEHAPSRTRVDAERAFLARLGGDCDLPAGAHAWFDPADGTERAGAGLRIEGFLAASGEVGAASVRHLLVAPSGHGADPVALGTELADQVRTRLDQP
jgi:hydroxymethylbilane synthase